MKKICGFQLQTTQSLPELNGKMYTMEHVKSGARLVYLERPEVNKTFGIAFQTQPWDDTGAFHILEHSVLCGSQRYPVKEPFVELMKGSLNTFLNALTFPDKTFYPVSSRNDQDFLNLIRVYLDAVFHPMIYSNPMIFEQEGWHYELDGKGKLSYKGVVFSEMKGALNSPDARMGNELKRRLFPDTCYRFVSGGDPVHIPELTYERFAEAHKRLYHPSNSYLFLDGQMDLEQVLTILDGEFLSAYDRTSPPPSIPMQQPVDGGTAVISYELSKEEALEGKVRLGKGFVAGTFRDREELVALQVLCDVLCGDNQAPLKRHMLERGLVKDVRMTLQDGIQQPWVQLEAQSLREEDISAVWESLQEELKSLAEGGLDRDRVLAALDNAEFQLRERDFGQMPQGIVFGFQVLESWMYGGDPAANLEVGDLFERLREKCRQGFFETLIQRVLLDNPHTSRVELLPSHTLGEQMQQQEKARLDGILQSWSLEQRNRCRQRQKDLEQWQRTPDCPEKLKTIPSLQLHEISTKPEKLPLEEMTCSGLPVLCHKVSTGGITYLNLYFALDDMSGEQLTQISFLCELLGRVDTACHTTEELQKELRSRLGTAQFSVESYGTVSKPEKSRTFLCASFSAMDTKLFRGAELVAEIMNQSKLDDAQKVYALLVQRRQALSEQIVQAGSNYALGRVSACFTSEGAVWERVAGIDYLRWLRELETHFEERYPALLQALESLRASILVLNRLTMSVTAGNSDAVEPLAAFFAKELPLGAPMEPKASIVPVGVRREGIVIPGDTSYAAMGGVMLEASGGNGQVLCRLESLAHLWNQVRVQGGAYGVGLVSRLMGLAVFYSYRDPNAARTLGCYRESADFLQQLEGIDLKGYIIGAVAQSDPQLTPRMKGKTADNYYWRGLTYGKLCQVRKDMLTTTPVDLMNLAESMRQLTASGAICVLGSQTQIQACKEELDQIEVL